MTSNKYNLLGVLVNATTYRDTVARVMQAARNRVGLSVTALAVHGLVTAYSESEYRYRLNHFDIVTPDGQPIRWALNTTYRVGLKDRVYGPKLMLLTCEAAAENGIPIYLYGSRQVVLTNLRKNLQERFPGLIIAGLEESKFRTVTPEEKQAITERIRASGAQITFVGLGCPRQETFAYEYRDNLSMPVMAVGAAFDYHAGLLQEPPMFMQQYGLQWIYRLIQEPKRLGKRYLMTNSAFICLYVLQRLGFWHPDPLSANPPRKEVRFG